MISNIHMPKKSQLRTWEVSDEELRAGGAEASAVTCSIKETDWLSSRHAYACQPGIPLLFQVCCAPIVCLISIFPPLRVLPQENNLSILI